MSDERINLEEWERERKAVEADGAESLSSSISDLSLESFHRISERMLYRCIVSITELINQQIERLPSQLELLSASSSRESLSRSYHSVPDHVKSTMRSLSEDAWTIFHSLTGLIRQRSAASRSPSPKKSTPEGIQQHAVNVGDLRDQLERLVSRVHEFDRVSQETLLKSDIDIQGPQISGLVERLRGRSRSDVSVASSYKLNRRLIDFYEAAKEMGTFAGEKEALQNMATVLSELDCLVTSLDDEYTSDTDADQRSYEYDEELIREELALAPKCGQHLLWSIAPRQDKGSEREQNVVFESVSVESGRRERSKSQDKMDTEMQNNSSRERLSETNLEKSYNIALDKNFDPKSSLTFTDSGKGTLCSTDTDKNQFSSEVYNKHQKNENLPLEKFRQKEQPFHLGHACLDSHSFTRKPQRDEGKHSVSPIKCDSGIVEEKKQDDRHHGRADDKRMSSAHRDKPSCTHLETSGSLDRQTTERNPQPSLRSTSYSGKYFWLESSTSLDVPADKSGSSSTESMLDIESWEHLDKTLSWDLIDLYSHFDFAPENKDSDHISRITASDVTTDPDQAEHLSKVRLPPESTKTHATNQENTNLATQMFLSATDGRDQVSELQLPTDSIDCAVTGQRSCSPNNLSNRSENSERQTSNISLKLAGSFWTRQSTGCSGDEESLNQWVSDFCDSTVRQINELIAERKSSTTKSDEDKQSTGQEAQLHNFKEVVRQEEPIYSNNPYYQPNSSIGEKASKPRQISYMSSDNVAERDASSAHGYIDRSPRHRRRSSSNGSLFESTIRQLNEMIAGKIISAANSVQDILVTVTDNGVAPGKSDDNHQPVELEAQFSDLMDVVKSAFSDRQYYKSSSEISEVNKSSQVSHRSSPREAAKHTISARSDNGLSPRHSSSSNGSLFENTIRQLNEMISNKILSAACSNENMQATNAEITCILHQQGLKASEESSDISDPDRRESQRPSYSFDSVNDQTASGIVERKSGSTPAGKKANHNDEDQLSQETQENLSIRDLYESAVLQLKDDVVKKVNSSEAGEKWISQGDSFQSWEDDEKRLFDEEITSNSARQYNPPSSATVLSNTPASQRRPVGGCEEGMTVRHCVDSGSAAARSISSSSDEEGVKSNNNTENSASYCVVSNVSKESKHSDGISRIGLAKTNGDLTSTHKSPGSKIISPYDRTVRHLAEMIDGNQISAAKSKEAFSQAKSDNRIHNRQIKPDRLLREIGLTEPDGQSANDTGLVTSGGKRRLDKSTSGNGEAYERAFNSGSIDEMQDASLAKFNNLILTKLLAENGVDESHAGSPENDRFQNAEDNKAQVWPNARGVSQCSSVRSSRKSTLADVCPVCDQVTSGNVDLDQQIPSNRQSSYGNVRDILNRSVDGRFAIQDQDRSSVDQRFELNTESSRNFVNQKSLTSSWSRLDRDEHVASNVGSNKSSYMYQSVPSQSEQSQRSSATSQQSSCPKCGKSISWTTNDRDEESMHTYTVSSTEELVHGLRVNDLPSASAATASGGGSRNTHRLDTSVKGNGGIRGFFQELNKSGNDEYSMGSKEDLRRSLAEHCFSSERRLVEGSPAVMQGISMDGRDGDINSDNSEDSTGNLSYKTGSAKLSIPSNSALCRKSSVASTSSSRKGRGSEKGSVYTDKSHVSPRLRTGNNDDTKGFIRNDNSSMRDRNPSDTSMTRTRDASRRSSKHGRTRERSTADSNGHTGYSHDTPGYIKTGENSMAHDMASDTFLSLKGDGNHERSRTSLNRNSDHKIGPERRGSCYKDNQNRGLIDSDPNMVWQSIPSNASVEELTSATSQRSIGVRRCKQVVNTKSDDGVDAERVYNDYSIDGYSRDRPDNYGSIPQSAQPLSVDGNVSSAVSQQSSTGKTRRDKSTAENQEIYASERHNSSHNSDDLRARVMESGRCSARQSIGSDSALSHMSTANSTSSWSILDREVSTAPSDASVATQGECYSFSCGEASGMSFGSYTSQNLNSESRHSQDASEIRPISIDPDLEIYLSDEGGQSIHNKETADYQNDSLSDILDQALQTSDAESSHVSSSGSLSEDQGISQVKGNTPPRAASDSLRNSARASSNKSTRNKSIRTSSSEGSKASVTSDRRFYSSSSSDSMSEQECSRVEKQNGGMIVECPKENSEERNIQNRSSEFFPHIKMSVPGISLPRYLTPTCKSVENISWTVFPTSSRSCPSLNMSPIRRLTKWSYSSTMAGPDTPDGGWRLLITILTYFCFFFTAFVILGSALNTKNLSFSDCSEIFFEDIYKNLEYKHINGACF